MNKVDVIIIGGGVVGTATAYYTAAQGASVVLIERGEIASGSSYGNAGLVIPSHCHPLPSPGVVAQGLSYLMDPDGPFWIRWRPERDLLQWFWRFYRSCNESHFYHAVGIYRKLGLESFNLHQELAREAGSEYEFTTNGLLSLFSTEKAFEESQHDAARMKSYGIETSILSGNEVRELEPKADPNVLGGIFHKPDGYLNPAKFVAWLARQAELQGAQILTQTEVFDLDHSQRRVHRVVTTRGDFEGDQIVLAAGAWLPQLAAKLGVRVAIQAAKGYSITFECPEGTPSYPLLLEEARVAVTPLNTGMRLAGTLEMDGLNLDINRRRLNAILHQAQKFLPGLKKTPSIEIWRGLRPCTPDGLPIIGRLFPFKNVLAAGGHATKGMSLGPVSGKHLSQLLDGKSIGTLERQLRPNRF